MVRFPTNADLAGRHIRPGIRLLSNETFLHDNAQQVVSTLDWFDELEDQDPLRQGTWNVSWLDGWFWSHSSLLDMLASPWRIHSFANKVRDCAMHCAIWSISDSRGNWIKQSNMISISHPISMSRSLNNYYKALVVYHHPVTKSISGKIVVESSRLKESHCVLFAVRWFTQSSRNIQSMQLISDTNSLDDNYYQNLSQESQLYMAKMRWVLYETQYTCVISNASN